MPFIIYSYDVPIDLANPPLYDSLGTGARVINIRTPAGQSIKIRAFRMVDDDLETMRLYNNVQADNVQVTADNDWVQIPNMLTDVRTDGDLHTGTMTFREHIEP